MERVANALNPAMKDIILDWKDVDFSAFVFRFMMIIFDLPFPVFVLSCFRDYFSKGGGLNACQAARGLFCGSLFKPKEKAGNHIFPGWKD
jgi:hypothetical protein